jgi:hypothetical protein
LEKHIDHRRQQHEAVGTDLLRSLRIADRTTGIVFGDAGDDRHATGDRLDDCGEHLDLLIELERVVLAHRPERDHTRYAVTDQVIDDPLCISQIDRQILTNLRRHRWKNALPFDRHSFSTFLRLLIYILYTKSLSRCNRRMACGRSQLLAAG